MINLFHPRLALCSLFLLTSAATAQTPALKIGETLPLPNADFEKEAESWTVAEKAPLTQFTPEAARTGKTGLHINDSDEKYGSSALSSPIQTTAGQGYKLTFWAKSSESGAAGVSLWFSDAARRTIYEYQPTTVLRKSDDWTQYQLLTRAPLTSTSFKIWIHSFSTAKATVAIDDLRLGTATGQAITDLPVPVPDSADAAAHERHSPPYIILKLDDMVSANGRVYNQWKKVADLARDRNIKATMGIICNSLEGDQPEYFNWIKEQHASGRIEFWNHGYDHKQWKEGDKDVWEFQGPSYQQQKQHFERSQQLAKEKLGLPLVTFGPPFGATDANTAKALSEIPELKIWLYADSQDAAGKIDLNRVGEVNIESPLFRPSLEKFIAGYKRYPDRDYFVIQGHPQQWDEARFAEFAKIIDYLIEQKAIFTTPTELVALRAKKPLAATALPAPKVQPASLQTTPGVAQPQTLLSNGDFQAGLNAGWTFTGHATPQIVDAQIDGAPFKRALQVELAATKESQPWDARLSAAPTQTAIAKGDLLLVQFWARSTPKSRIRVIFQQSVQPYGKSVRQTASLTPKWQKYTFYAPAASNYSAGGSNFELQLGQANGKVEVTGLSVENKGALTVAEATKRFGPETFDYYGGEDHDDSWIPAAEARIEQIRKADVKITVVDGQGKPVPGAKVTLQQTRSAFRWGTAVNERVLEQSPDGEKYRAHLKRLFNTAVPDNPLKWKYTDGNPTAQARSKAIVNWLVANGLAVRGHNIVWGSNKFLPGRLQNLSPEALRAELAKRVPDAMNAYKGKLYVWDVVNEAATETELWDKIGWQSFADVYKQARATDPQVQLAYNDYNIANEAPDNGVQRLKVEDRIQKLLDANAPLDILGDQAHMLVPLTPLPRVLQIWDDWGRKYKLPIEITEFDANIADDAAHEKYVHDFLIAAFSNPNIESFLVWGFWEKAHWLGLSGSLFRADWSPRPAALTYENLVLHKWRTNATLTTGKIGAAQTRAFLGDYEVQITAGGKTTTTQLSLDKNGAQKTLVLQ